MRGLAIALVAGLLVLMPSPAQAAPEDCDLLCVEIGGDDGLLDLDVPLIESLLDAVNETLEPIITPAPSLPPIVPAPSPTAPPPPASITPTPTPSQPITPQQPTPPPVVPSNVPAPSAPSTPVESSAPQNTQAGQEPSESATLAETESAPPRESGGAIDAIVPDDPEVAAVTGSLVGLFIGLIAAFFLMMIAYKRGQEAGIAATVEEFETLRN